MIKKHSLITLILLIIVLGGAWYVFQQKPQPKQKSHSAADLVGSQVSIEDFSSNSYRLMKLTAPQITMLYKSGIITAEKAQLAITIDDTKTALVNSELVLIDSATKNSTLQGAVSGSLNELSFKTADAFYNAEQNTLEGKNTIYISHPLFTMTAASFQADIKQQNLHFFGGVQSTFLFTTAGHKGNQ